MVCEAAMSSDPSPGRRVGLEKGSTVTLEVVPRARSRYTSPALGRIDPGRGRTQTHRRRPAPRDPRSGAPVDDRRGGQGCRSGAGGRSDRLISIRLSRSPRLGPRAGARARCHWADDEEVARRQHRRCGFRSRSRRDGLGQASGPGRSPRPRRWNVRHEGLDDTVRVSNGKEFTMPISPTRRLEALNALRKAGSRIGQPVVADADATLIWKWSADPLQTQPAGSATIAKDAVADGAVSAKVGIPEPRSGRKVAGMSAGGVPQRPGDLGLERRPALGWRSPHTASQFASIRWPPWVSTDSGMELDAVDRQLAVPHRHHHPVSVRAVTSSSAGHRLRQHRQRVVAGGGERVRQPGEHAARRGGPCWSCRAAVRVRGRRCRRTPRRSPGARGTPRAAACRPRRMRAPVRCDAGPLRRARAGVSRTPSKSAAACAVARRRAGRRRCARPRLRAELTQILHQVEHEAVVVVDDQNAHREDRVNTRCVSRRLRVAHAAPVIDCRPDCWVYPSPKRVAYCLNDSNSGFAGQGRLEPFGVTDRGHHVRRAVRAPVQ